MTTLIVVLPFSVVGGSVCVSVSAMAVLLVFHPVTIEYVAISMHQLSYAMGETIYELTLILCTVWERANSVTVLDFAAHLTGVRVAIGFQEVFNKDGLISTLFKSELLFQFRHYDVSQSIEIVALASKSRRCHFFNDFVSLIEGEILIFLEVHNNRLDLIFELSFFAFFLV